MCFRRELIRGLSEILSILRDSSTVSLHTEELMNCLVGRQKTSSSNNYTNKTNVSPSSRNYPRWLNYPDVHYPTTQSCEKRKKIAGSSLKVQKLVFFSLSSRISFVSKTFFLRTCTYLSGFHFYYFVLLVFFFFRFLLASYRYVHNIIPMYSYRVIPYIVRVEATPLTRINCVKT